MSVIADPLEQAQLVAVLEEMNAIYLANLRYWNLRQHSHEKDMEHERRKERLEQIRKECGWTDAPWEEPAFDSSLSDAVDDRARVGSKGNRIQ
jgi:hypothetical protein